MQAISSRKNNPAPTKGDFVDINYIARRMGFSDPRSAAVLVVIAKLTPIHFNQGKGRPRLRYLWDEVDETLRQIYEDAKSRPRTTSAESICANLRDD